MEYQTSLTQGQPDDEAVRLLQYYEALALENDPRGYCVCRDAAEIFGNGKMASIKCWQKKKYCKMGRTLKKYTHLSMTGVPICCS